MKEEKEQKHNTNSSIIINYDSSNIKVNDNFIQDVKKLSECFKAISLTASLALNDSVKSRCENERLSNVLAIRNNEIEYYVKTKVNYEYTFKRINEFLNNLNSYDLQTINSEIKKELINLLILTDELKPYELNKK